MSRQSFDLMHAVALPPGTGTLQPVQQPDKWLAMLEVVSDGTNPATLIVRQGDAGGGTTGALIWERTTSSTAGISAAFPVKLYNGYIYYDLQGTGAKAYIREPRFSDTP